MVFILNNRKNDSKACEIWQRKLVRLKAPPIKLLTEKCYLEEMPWKDVDGDANSVDFIRVLI